MEGIDDQTTVDSTVDITPEINSTGIVMQTTNYTCGPAALVTVLNNMGINATEQELMNLAGTDENGTTMYGLAEAAKAKGLKAVGMKLSINDLKPNNIVFITVDGGPHYSVVKEITENRVRLADPSLGNIEMSKEKFAEVYSGNALVISDPNNSTQVNGITNQTNNLTNLSSENTNSSESVNNETDANSTSVQSENRTLTTEEMQNIRGKGMIYVWVKGWHFVHWRYVFDWHWVYCGYGKYGYTFAYIKAPRWIWDPHWEYGWYKKKIWYPPNMTLPNNYAGNA
ncbi:MAG: C39 family peptidase [Euryarchaeota archaeon]|nr:C39 family peptidase [Euryarchaeota archaeon]